ncbi:1-acyl-sn-glycerol-3-phosphate acyltransferase [Shinella kummerowiae]|jgi:1-acyl-sn-glycerol-3-phosphate acyltransferase|uniref:1-acyl-sn-glycerol-3-phosphate acyltransferase n=1 Tax=Shinella kummerowiae TaxID=417745 RepID=A0A6N8SCT3_9HYPH|nr:lysophospholipid acyltransferase family protein [Shinella kummerowiae]MXN46729.1 1-acyl-sn-glycerol-3-phosphate acyltransferase [Shinella kummerowiae]
MTGGGASLLQKVSGAALAGLSRAVTGVRPIWAGAAPNGRQRIYFANHASHGDFILISTCLHPAERSRTAAVAGADYWNADSVRRFISGKLLRTVLVERNWVERTADPLQVMLSALDAGESLIFFPEGTRNMTEELLLRFRSGLYNLAAARPDVELVPCWIENMSRVLPKGAVLPVPLLCRVIFGAPIALEAGEERKAFLDKARQALLTLAPKKDGHR